MATGRRLSWSGVGLAAACLLFALLVWPVTGTLWSAWRTDPAFSHGPLVPLIAAGLLWMRKSRLSRWDAADYRALALIIPSCLLHVASMWGDLVFLKPVSLIGVLLGALWFLGGWRAAGAAAGPLGFLLFTVPWPTTVTERLALPLQMTSTAYAALCAGLLGIPIHREGVELSVMGAAGGPPIYSMIVAAKCSGLASLIVLLALAYLVAYFTPLHLGWRALLMALVVPLTLVANTVRLTLILVAGANHSPSLAQWVHDHEAPVLIFFCSLGLLAIQQWLVKWATRPSTETRLDEALPPAGA
ncbi:MAG TPA: exosortase/archaeosortase family protein [Armatimonadota bacterium]|nr:exosortase/archaeosortase family protein [Armatimonadota bacterium]